MTRYITAVLLLVAAMSAQNAPSTNKGRHLDIPAISREAHGAVVSIIMSDKEGHPLAQGSGFVISKDGRIVTNYHVIKSGCSAIMKLPNGAFFAVDGVLAFDKHRDVAIIKAHGNDFRALTLGDSARLQVGQQVIAIGSPLSLESTVSNGIISAIRTVEEEGGKFVQITAPISPGSSGGPLFNMAGEVVGITTAGLVGGENLNFAIPINDARPLLTLPVSQALLALPNEPEVAPARTEATARTDNANPSLEETEQWMNKFTVAYARTKTSRSVLQFNQCEVTDHPFLGTNVDLGEPSEQSTELRAITSYTLADVDPTQISVRSSVMNFANSNAKRSINHSGVFYSANWFVVFDSEEHANQFAKAFKHAVDLCGGKASTF
jgi:hypothetical protein